MSLSKNTYFQNYKIKKKIKQIQLKSSIFNSLNIFFKHLIYYPTPLNLNYIWSIGFVLGIIFGIQIISGILLSMFYTPSIDSAFYSIEILMRDINNGWILRYLHMNGASIIFILIYIHIRRSLYYRSYLNPRVAVWLSGLLLLILFIITSFLGYVLPWGQMSFWAATVITNLVTIIPFFGNHIAEWLWGGYTISNFTLNRFFRLHYILPFIISCLIIVHLKLLHDAGSSNPLGNSAEGTDFITFYPYFFYKDLRLLFGTLVILFGLVFFAPNMFNHPDNYIQANSLVTPTHIVPEWYFLFFYAILRAIPDKMMGILFLIGSLVMLIHLIIIHSKFINKILFHSSLVSFFHQFFFWRLISNFIIISWMGSQAIEYPYNAVIRYYIMGYFIILGFGFFILNNIEFSIFSKNKITE